MLIILEAPQESSEELYNLPPNWEVQKQISVRDWSFPIAFYWKIDLHL